LSRYDEGFIPMRPREALREVRPSDPRPLVLAEETLAPHRLAPPPDEAPRLRGKALVAGLLLAGAVLLAGRRWPRALAGFALAFWLLAGLAGALMLYLWMATAHRDRKS